MSAEKIIKLMREQGAVFNSPSVEIAEVTSISPFKIKLNDVELTSDFDIFYLNNLTLDNNINLNLSSLGNSQSFTDSTAYNSPSFSAKISGSIPQFITDFYNFFKNYHNRYILHIGDLVGVQRLGNNAYIILQKVQKV